MTKKKFLYAGLFLLAIGILLKIVTDLTLLPVCIILSGVLFKVLYIIRKIRKDNYKPGYEFLILCVGLILFLTGIYLRSHGSSVNPAFFMIPGIAFKITFLVLFIRKSHNK